MSLKHAFILKDVEKFLLTLFFKVRWSTSLTTFYRVLELVTSIAGTKKKLLAAPGEVINDADHPPVLVDQLAKHVAKLHKSDDRGYMIEYNVIIIIFPPISPCRLKAIRANPYFELKSTLSVFTSP